MDRLNLNPVNTIVHGRALLGPNLTVHFGRSTGYRLHYRNIKCDLFESDGKQGTTDNIGAVHGTLVVRMVFGLRLSR